MNLTISNPALLGNIFFALAHIVSWIILIWYGRKHRYPLVSWLIIMVSGYLFFTIGSHLLAFDPKSLVESLREGMWPSSRGISLVSGLLLAVPAMLLMKHLLGFRNLIFEPYAFAIPVAIAIQRVGCLAAGCCFGTYTKLPWGISYQPGHRIHYLQWKEGLIEHTELHSLSLHPVQLYESIMCLLIFLIIIHLYRRQKFAGRLVYVSLLFYCISRIISEFFRAAEAHTIGTSQLLGLNSVQWMMLLAGLVFTYQLWRKTYDHSSLDTSSSPVQAFALSSNVFWYLILLALIVLSPGFYSPIERLLLGILFVPLTFLMSWELFRIITVRQLRAATASLCVIAIFLMSQISPANEERNTPKKYHEVSIGGYSGSNGLTHYYTTCDGDQIEDHRFKEKYYNVGVGYKYAIEFNEDQKLTLGMGASYGNLEEHVEEINYTYSQSSYSISPYVQYDLRKIGFGLGVLAGDISVFRGEARTYSVFTRYSLLPQVHFRFGNKNKIWGELNYGYRFSGIFPANEYELLLGLQGEHGHTVRIGTSAFNAITIRPLFYVTDQIGIEPYVGLFGPLTSSSYKDRGGYQAGINLHYRFYR